MRNLILKNLVQIQSIQLKKSVQLAARKSCLHSRTIHTTSSINSERWFTETHEWIKVDGNTGTIGITDYAQGKLGDIVFCELPEVGTKFEEGDSFAVVESVKAASDLYLPVAAEITEVNEILADEPGVINSSPLDDGWLVKVNFDENFNSSKFLDLDAYNKVKNTDE